MYKENTEAGANMADHNQQIRRKKKTKEKKMSTYFYKINLQSRWKPEIFQEQKDLSKQFGLSER
jgi:hypothetical protein